MYRIRDSLQCESPPITCRTEVERPIAVVMTPQRKQPKATMCVRSYLSPSMPLIGELTAYTTNQEETQRSAQLLW